MTVEELRDQSKRLSRADAWSDLIGALIAERSTVEKDFVLSWDLGWAYFKLEECEQSILWLQRAKALQPADAKARWALGQALLDAGRAAEAELELLQSIVLRDTYFARMSLAMLYLQAGRISEAERVHVEGTRLAPDDGRRLGAYADFLLDAGRVAESEEVRRRVKAARLADDGPSGDD